MESPSKFIKVRRTRDYREELVQHNFGKVRHPGKLPPPEGGLFPNGTLAKTSSTDSDPVLPHFQAVAPKHRRLRRERGRLRRMRIQGTGGIPSHDVIGM